MKTRPFIYSVLFAFALSSCNENEIVNDMPDVQEPSLSLTVDADRKSVV